MKNLTFLFLILGITFTVSGQSFLERGVASYQQQDFKQAVRWFDWAIAADSTNAVCFLNRGQAKRSLNDTEGAFNDFSMAVKLNPNDADAHFFLALAAYSKGDYNASVSGNSEAIRLQTSMVSQALLNRAQSFIQLGKNKDALKDYASVIELKDHNLVNGYFNRAQLYMRMNDKRSALADYKKVVELNPKNIQLTWDIGRVSYEIEEYADALTYYSRAMDQIDKPETQLYLIRGEVFEKLENYEAAIEDYTRVIEMNPNLAQAHYSRGQAKARMGNKESACIDWKKASELGHDEAKGVIVYNCK